MEIRKNQIVWAKHSKYNRIAKCQILKVDKIPLCIVEFNDGSISDNIGLKDIKVKNIFFICIKLISISSNRTIFE